MPCIKMHWRKILHPPTLKGALFSTNLPDSLAFSVEFFVIKNGFHAVKITY
jgi:hypothetical protein